MRPRGTEGDYPDSSWRVIIEAAEQLEKEYRMTESWALLLYNPAGMSACSLQSGSCLPAIRITALSRHRQYRT
jgi:hypothetical protein